MRLREQLQEISANEQLLISEQTKAIERLGVKSVSEPDKWQHMNCFAYALGLGEWPQYAGYVEPPPKGPGIFANSAFINYLFQKAALHPAEEMESGSIALYFDGVQARHAGIVLRQDVICSRWGNIATFEHCLWEVPSSYGADVRYYQALQPSDAKLHFLTFAENSGRLKPGVA